MISSTEFFITGVQQTFDHFLAFKLTFESLSPNWRKKLQWSSTPWYSYISEYLLSTDNSLIHAFAIFGNLPNYGLYVFSMYVSDGSIFGSRYKASIGWVAVWGISLNGDNIAAIVQWLGIQYLIILNIASTTSVIRTFTPGILLTCQFDQSATK